MWLFVALNSGIPALAATPVQNLSNGSGNPESDIQTMNITGLLSRYRDPQIGPGTREALAIMVGVCDGGVVGNTNATLLVPIAGASPTIAGGFAAIPCIPSSMMQGGSDGLATGINSAIIVFSGPGAHYIRTVRMYWSNIYSGPGGQLFQPGDLIQQVTAQYNSGTGEAIVQLGRTQEQMLTDLTGKPVAAYSKVGAETSPALIYFTADIGDDATSGHVYVALGLGAGDDTAQGMGGICAQKLGYNCGSNFMRSGPETSSFDIIGGSSGGGGGVPPPPGGGGAFSLTLHPGWNMISSPIGSTPLSAIQGNCSFSGGPWWWDGAQYQNASMIESAKGYWVKANGACTMQASGSPTPEGLSLHDGWNMISSSGSWNQMNTGSCNLLSGPFWYDGTQYQSVGPDQPMNDFLGYWVKIGGSCSVTSQSLRESQGEASLAPTTDNSLMPPGESRMQSALSDLRVTMAKAGEIELQLIGSGIAASELRLYSLSGELVAQVQGRNTLRVTALSREGRPLANGVYLYIVTVKGTNGQTITSDVKKLVVMR
jgi:hypothetical protein